MKKYLKDFIVFIDGLPINKLIPLMILAGIVIGFSVGFYEDLFQYIFGGFFE